MEREELERICRLCKISLNEGDIGPFSKQITRILDYFNKLDDLVLEDFEINSGLVGDSRNKRFDKVEKETPELKTIQKNMPEVQDGYLKVPKIIPSDKDKKEK